ncbi:winged helix-turn-helix domain-containing protein [Caballeronia insecticola]|uniref:Transcriptional regulator winged helix family n=1 Tax=Caballeronia insecticola TaxID=758793 RepID=R4X1G9_9BURK|nr:winged helix-turn-helix domain-containing protein [Caballeronia insecticola]BAN28205.1 transcriptional regulator winged helix family [Caballeronia insecticola]
MKIGEFEILRETRQVLRRGERLPISSSGFDLLQLLLDANGELVSTEEILGKVWPCTVVDKNNIQVHVSKLRRMLGEHRDLIQTVSGRGYRISMQPYALNERSSSGMPSTGADLTQTGFVLPGVQGRLFGRERCIGRLLDAFDRDELLVTLAGPGGVGKSRLAIETAGKLVHDRGVQVAHVSLADASTQKSAYDLIGAALETLGSAALLKRTDNGPDKILILDDCDRSHDAALQAIRDSSTFRHETRTALLLTTRAPLNASMETVIRVPALSASASNGEPNDAVEMFISRVQTLSPDSEIGDDFATKAHTIVTEMDGLPLAIELAARYTAMLGIDSVCYLLERDIPLPSHGVRRMVESRHGSLDSTFLWTWVEPSHADRDVLMKFIDAEADALRLQEIVDATRRSLEVVIAALDRLVDRCLLLRSLHGATVTYRMPRTVKRFLRHRGVLPPADAPKRDAR